MRMILFVLLASAFSLPAGTVAKNNIDHNYASRLWYARPATHWNEALPIGNGRMGAMIFGGAAKELVQLNEQTLWSGAPRNWNNPSAKAYLPLVREAVQQKNYRKADSLAKFMQGPYTESYMPMADMIINYHHITDSSNYTRQLNLDSAMSKVVFSDHGHIHTRTAFASFPDQAIIYHDTSTAKGGVSFTVTLSSKLHYKVETLASNHIVLKGKCPQHVEPVYLRHIKDEQAVQYAPGDNGEGMNFELHLLVKTNSGMIANEGNAIRVSHADAATLIITAATSYNGYNRSPGLDGKDPSLKAASDLRAASGKSFEQLQQRHIGDYQPIFRRVHLNLGESANKDLPTDERLQKMPSYTDPELIATISQYGRYLLIAGSRPGGQPVNLKGIWNDKVRPEYSSNWCIDHDAQMFYYAVETNNLSEMHQPFLQFIGDLSANGKQTAAVNYGMHGWCAHHNTDLWRQTGPVGNYGDGNPHWATWNMSGPWLCAHLFDHYLFTGDKAFLRQKAWPLMKGAALFCLDWLSADKNGLLTSAPSVSPENTFITTQGDTAQVSANSTADMAMIKELFTNCIRALSILETDKPHESSSSEKSSSTLLKDPKLEMLQKAPVSVQTAGTPDNMESEKALAERLKKALALLPGYKTGTKGQLLEWEEEWRPVDPSHRHLSHMYPVFPGSEISPLHTPALAAAARKALSLREKTNSSWGFSLKAACWARLGEGDSAWQTLQYQLQYVDSRSESSDNKYGLYPNLFNSEAPATIMNGNGCVTAVITEMLVQSQAGEIQLLPALPSFFKTGDIRGICARGGFVIDLSWKDNRLGNAVIYSTLGNDCILKTGIPIKVFDGKKQIPAVDSGDNVFTFKTVKGRGYDIRPL